MQKPVHKFADCQLQAVLYLFCTCRPMCCEVKHQRVICFSTAFTLCPGAGVCTTVIVFEEQQQHTRTHSEAGQGRAGQGWVIKYGVDKGGGGRRGGAGSRGGPAPAAVTHTVGYQASVSCQHHTAGSLFVLHLRFTLAASQVVLAVVALAIAAQLPKASSSSPCTSYSKSPLKNTASEQSGIQIYFACLSLTC